jgi:hypothetical protein
MPRYAAYGLGIRSEIELPDLIEADAGDDIVIRRGDVPRPSSGDLLSDDYVRTDDETVVFHTSSGGFRLHAAREITVDASTDSSPTALRLAILGRCLGALLQWRGRFVLHASAVARDGRVVAFAGHSGAGKSTAAAALMAGGWDLVADDVVAIDLDVTPPRVLPAFPQVKLWPDSAIALGIELGAHERVHERLDKRMVAIDARRLVAAELPLGALFVLEEGPAQVLRLTATEAVIAVLRYSYAPRIMRALGRQGEHLAQCATLATSAPPIVLRREDAGREDAGRDLAAREPSRLAGLVEAIIGAS